MKIQCGFCFDRFEYNNIHHVECGKTICEACLENDRHSTNKCKKCHNIKEVRALEKNISNLFNPLDENKTASYNTIVKLIKYYWNNNDEYDFED